MKKLILSCTLLLALPLTAQAVPVDIVGGPAGAQTIHHCGFLPVSPGHYTDSTVTTGIIEQKLIKLGFLKTSGSGRYSAVDKKAVRAFQRDEGLQADGIVGPMTAQRLAYVTDPDINVHRCFGMAAPLR